MTEFKNHYIFFTYGSVINKDLVHYYTISLVTNDQSACPIYSKDVEIKIKLPNDTRIFSAEL